MVANAIDVRIENQLVRFVPPQPVDQDSVVAQLGGQKTGGVVIKVLDRPRATIVIDQQGRIPSERRWGLGGTFGLIEPVAIAEVEVGKVGAVGGAASNKKAHED